MNMTWKRNLVAAVVAASLGAGVSGCGSDDKTDDQPQAQSSSVEPTPVVPQVGERSKNIPASYQALDTKRFERWNDQAGRQGQSDPLWVMRAGLAESFAWEPKNDSGQFEAFRRAQTNWNGEYLKTNEVKLTTLVPMSSKSWELWGDEDVTFEPRVHVLSDQHPPDTKTDVSRVVSIDMMKKRPGEKPVKDFSITGYVRVHNAADGGAPQWRVDNLTVTDTVVEGVK